MASGQITRTFVTARAYAWCVTGKDAEGKPMMDKVGDVEFTSTKPTIKEAFRALKNAGIPCRKEFANFDVVEEKIFALDIDTFLEHAVEVTRLPNGRVVNETPVLDSDTADSITV